MYDVIVDFGVFTSYKDCTYCPSAASAETAFRKAKAKARRYNKRHADDPAWDVCEGVYVKNHRTGEVLYYWDATRA